MKLFILLAGLNPFVNGLSLQTLSRNRLHQGGQSKLYNFIKISSADSEEKTLIRNIQRYELANKECWMTENNDGRKNLECSNSFHIPDGFERFANTFGFRHIPHSHIGINGKRH